MHRIGRRTFIASAIGVGAVGVAGASGWLFLSTDPEEVVVRIVRDRLPGIRIADDDLRAFARDFLVYDRTSRSKLMALRAALPVMQSGTLSNAVPERAQELFAGFERRVISKFTMSTDFFQREPGDDRPLAYVAFADPYLLGCANPLARFDLESA